MGMVGMGWGLDQMVAVAFSNLKWFYGSRDI